MYKTREEVEIWLNQMRIKNYVINEDLTVDVNGTVDISDKELKEIPIQFRIIKDNFYCDNNKLSSFKGCPKVISGNFDCSENRLTSLKGCSEVVNGSFYCDNNKITSLKGCPKEVNGVFDCSNNELTSLKDGPTKVNSNFHCNDNKLTDLKYFPNIINGNFIYMNENEIKEEELVNFNCDITNVTDIYSDFNNKNNKEEFFGKVSFYKIKKENELLKELSVNSNNIKLNKKL